MKKLVTNRRAFLLGGVAVAAIVATAAPNLASQTVQDDSGELVDVRQFGASPSASADENMRAFAAAGQFLSRRGGGTLIIPPGEYIVGRQERAGRAGRKFAYRGDDVLVIEGCARPVTIRGTGACLKARPGLRFGSFHPISGAPFNAKTPFYDADYRAEAYRMVVVKNCSGPVRMEGLELDGNVGSMIFGGEWGDVGRQLPALGIVLESNTGAVTIAGVHSHHHGQDGIMVVHYHLSEDSPVYQVTLIDSVFDSNGRQGLSWVGGTGLTAQRCRFSRTGRAGILSPPGAGVDVEAEASVCRNGRFIECEFSDNGGVGFLAEAGDVAGITLQRCTFVGTTNWSAWPRKPHISFDECLFVGSIVNVFGSDDPRAATKFSNCRFKADASLSPTRQVFGSYLADLGGGAANVLMKDCEFDALLPTVALPWCGGDLIFDTCRFRQVGTMPSYPRGIYKGRNSIVSAGFVEIGGSKVVGELLLNGKRL